MSSRRNWIVLLLWCSPLLAEETSDEAQHVAFLSEHGFAVIRFHLTLDEQPLEKLRFEQLAAKCRAGDQNQDGAITAEEFEQARLLPEAAEMPNPAMMNVTRTWRPDFSLGDRSVSDIAAVLMKSSPALSWTYGTRRSTRMNEAGEFQDGSAADARLFQRLDTDGNQAWSARELSRAVAVLGRLDFDEDELITEAELSSQSTTMPSAGMMAVPAQSGDAHWLPLLRRCDLKITRRIFTQYDVKPKNFELSVQELGLPADVFAGGDADEDGAWLLDELRHFLEHPVPAAELSLGLWTGDSQADVKFAATDDRVQLLGQTEETLQLDLLGTQFELRLPRDRFPENASLTISVENLGRTWFGRLDANGDGRLSLRELSGLEDRLKACDTDGDGKLGQREVPRQYRLTFLSTAAFPRQSDAMQIPDANPARTLPTRDQPTWFQRMDRNGDGEISAREFLGPRDRFEKIDANRNGAIDAEEAAAVK